MSKSSSCPKHSNKCNSYSNAGDTKGRCYKAPINKINM